MARTVEEELIDVARGWDRAMVRNDPDAIGRYMADDWTIVGADGVVTDKPTFLGLVSTGIVTHDVMESHDIAVRVYGTTAIVMCRGISAGTYLGGRFREVERVSSVFVQQEGQWRCVLTHLSRIELARQSAEEPG